MTDVAYFFNTPGSRAQRPVIEIIRGALRKLGIVDTSRPLTADEAKDGLDDLNGILEQWSLESLNVYRVGEIRFQTIMNQTTYKIGPGEYIDAERPASIEECTDVSSPTIPIEVVEYASELQVSGRVLSYDPAFPSAYIYLGWYPQGESLSLIVNQELRRYETTNEAHGLPPGYERPLTLALAVAMASDYDVNPGPALISQAAASKRTLRNLSARLRVRPGKTGIGRINRGYPTSIIRGV